MEQQPLPRRAQWILLGLNGLIHFDSALYAYLMPLLAPLFFPGQPLEVQLTWGYATWAVALLAKPMGIFWFGTMVQRRKEYPTLRFALVGAGIGLLALGLLPMGGPAPGRIGWLLAARTAVEACAAGIQTISKLFLLRGSSLVWAKKRASWYEASSMAGILLASLVGTAVACADRPLCGWRLPFLLGGVATIGIAALVIDRGENPSMAPTHPVPTAFRSRWRTIGKGLWNERRAVFRIALATGFSYTTYALPFVCMNGFVPLVSNVSQATAMQTTTGLILLDLLLLVAMGHVSPKYDHNNVLAFSSGLLAATVVPLFWGLPGASATYATAVRLWICVLGIFFCGYLNLWCREQVQRADATAYLTVGFATVLGSSLWGKTTPAICLALWRGFGSPVAPACYVAALAFGTLLIMADSASE